MKSIAAVLAMCVVVAGGAEGATVDITGGAIRGQDLPDGSAVYRGHPLCRSALGRTTLAAATTGDPESFDQPSSQRNINKIKRVRNTNHAHATFKSITYKKHFRLFARASRTIPRTPAPISQQIGLIRLEPIAGGCI